MGDKPTPRRRKPHQKTRAGCVTCKRRKIKCDEGRPVCVNCIRFKAPCGYNNPGEPIVLLNYKAVDVTPPTSTSSPPRRKPGRPRRVWTDQDLAAASADTLQQWLGSQNDNGERQQPCQLDVGDVELLLHYTRYTAATIAAHCEQDAPDLRDFWTYDVPIIALKVDYVLRLILTVTARHMLFLEFKPGDPDRRRRLISLAEQNMAIAVNDMAHALSNLDEQNCGALYLASVLVCFCTFAAGPTGHGDLLVCSTADIRPRVCIPLIHGVRLIRQSFTLETLFCGELKPMNRQEWVMPAGWRPRWVHLGLSRLDWEEALGSLKTMVASQQDDKSTSRGKALGVLEGIYEMTYGRLSGEPPGELNPSHRYILTWLYQVDDDFITSLQRKDPVSLLLLAHFAPLLRNYQEDWFLAGWTEQLILGVRAILPEHYVSWMQWPLEAAGLLS